MSDKGIFDPERLDDVLSALPTVSPGNGVPLSFDPAVDSPDDVMRPEALQRSMGLASSVDPDAYAKQVQLAKSVGVSPDVVQDYENIAKRATLFNDPAIGSLPVTNPGVADFLITPHHAKIARDDVPQLKFIDNALKHIGTLDDVVPMAESGALMNQKAILDDRVQNGVATEADRRELKMINYSLNKRISESGATSAIGVASQVAGLYASMQPEAVAWAGAGAGIGTAGALILGSASPLLVVPEELATVPAAAAAFGAVGYRAGLANAMYRLEGTQAYNDSIANGDPEWRAQVNKFAVGSVNAALELVGFNVLMRPFSPLKKMIQEKAAARMAQGLADEISGKTVAETGKTLGTAIGRGAVSHLKTVSSEAGIEGLQRIVSESIPEITRAVTEAGYTIPPGRVEEIFVAGVEEAIIAAKGISILALPGSAVQVYTDVEKAGQAQERARVFEGLMSAAAESKTRIRDAETFQKFVETQAEKAGVKEVYIGSEQLGEVLQQLGLSIEKVRAIAPGVAAQLESPGNVGGDVAIPTEVYLTQVAHTDLGKALQQHVRFSPDGFSVAEAKEFEAMRPALVETASQEIDVKAEQKRVFDEELKEVETTLDTQLKEAAPHMSATERAQTKQVIQSMVATAASRANITPKVAYSRIVSQIGGMKDFASEQTAADETLEQPGAMTKRAWVEVAPSPDDMTWAPKWNAMSDPQRLSISRHMIAKYIPILTGLVPKAKMRAKEHVGSYEGDTNYAYTVKVGGGSINEITNALGYVFAQKGMVALSDKVFPGSFTANALWIPVGGKSLDEIHEMYTKIRALEGFPKIEGQTTAEGDMVILLSEEADPAEMATAIQALFNNEHEVTHGKVEAAFPGEKDYDYASKAVKLDGDREENRRGYRRLRAEFLRERNTLIDEALNPSGKLKGLEEVASLESAFAKAAESRSKTNRAFKLEIQSRVKEAAKKAGIDLEHFTPEVENYLVRVGLADALTALRTNPDAVGWYNEKVTIALEVLSLVHPEITTNKMSKFAFTWALAVTSNGLKVDKNFTLAEKAYSIYKETGQMPTDIGEGNASANINEGLEAFNDLVAEHGIETIEDFMTGLHTVMEIKEFIGKTVSGEHMDVNAYGAAFVGPKIGNGFFANLYGHYEQLTMDRWFMRTWGRWTGTLVNVDKKKVDAGRVRLKAAIGRMTPEQKKAFTKATGVKLLVGQLEDTARGLASASQDKAVREQMNSIPHGSEVRKAGNNLARNSDGQKEIPGNGQERKNIRAVMTQVLAELQITHPELTMADMQALLWYPEKKLYDSAKLEDTEEAYEEGEAPDYANAAIKLAKEKGVDADRIKGAVENAGEKILRANERTAVARRGERGDKGSQTVLEQAQRPARPRAIPATRSWVAAVKAEYGEQREGVAPILGVHFSDRSRETLSGSFYGTGLKGEEAGRVRRSTDERISKRIHFYVDEGQSIVPEGSVGHYIHAVKLNNIYHLGEDSLGFRAQWGEESESDWSNAMESAVIDAGYDGYYRPAAQGEQGMVVLLGDQEVNVDQMGLGYELWERVNTAELGQQARASWNPQTLVMLLGKDSDMSSVLHEFGHGFMSFYTKLAEQIDADQSVKDDVQTLMDWFGVKNLLEWNRMSLEEQRPYHEQFAYNWEKYLFTGKAPTPQLKGVFAKMSQWAKELYTGLVQRLNVTYRGQFGRDLPGLTPEVRKVFDRMIASEEQIDEMNKIEGLMVSFGVRPEGMSDEAWVEYNEMWEEVRNEAQTKLTVAMLRALKWESGARGRVLRELQGEAKAARDKIKDEVTAVFHGRPVSILAHFIKTGELRTPEGVVPAEKGGAPKISLAAAKRLLPTHKDRITEEVMDELMQEPEYRAERFIKTGELDAPGDISNADRKALDEVNSGTRSRKLDLDALKKIFKDEPEVWKGLRSKGLTSTNGINPNTLARLLRIKDLQTLLSIMEAKPDKLQKKLDKEVKARLSEVTEPDVDYKALGTGKNGMLSEQGADPELIAEDFRAIFPDSPIFETAESMLTALVEAQNENAEITRATDKRMIEENSDMLDPADIDLKVREAIHNKMLAKVVSIEHKYLTGSTKPANLTRRAARAVAHQMLMKIRLGRLNPVGYSKLSGRSARLAHKLMGKGDVAGAGRAKQGQLLQAEAFVEALHLKSVADQWLQKADRYRKDDAAKRIGDKGIEQIRQILYRYGISPRVPTQAELESRRPLAEHLQHLEGIGYIGIRDIVPDFIKDEAHTMPYSQLTVEQFDQLMQTINALDKLGTNEIKQSDMAYKERVAASAARIAEGIIDNVREPRSRKVAQTRVEKMLAGAKSFAWANVSIASIVRIFDGDMDNGPAFRELMAPANKAGDKEASMRAEAAQALEVIFEDAFGAHRVSLRNFATNISQGTTSPNYLREKIHIPALYGTPGYEDGKFTRGTLMVIALNLGNEGNKRLLLENYGWTEGQIQAAMSNLTESELLAVQKIWNYYEQFRPLIAESTRRREGREPQWTVPVPVSFLSSDGKEVNLAGGHFPIRYDTRGMTREDGQVTLEGVLGDPMQERRQQVVTAHGFEMERTKGKDTPILLDPSVIFIGLNEIIHDVAWRDTLIRINQMVKRRELKNAILSNYGEDVYNQLTNWITDVAVGNQVPAGDGAKLATFIGQNISFSRMAFSMTTLVKQPLGIIQSIPWLGDGDMRVGSSLLLGSLRSYLVNMKGTHELIAARSSFMHMRGSTLLRDLVELKNVLHGESGLMKTIKVNGFTLIARAQSIVDAITWMAAYNKNVAVYGEQQAAQIADQAVKSSQGSGLLHDLPATMREEGVMRLFTAFYSYRNATYNRLVVSGKAKGVASGGFIAEATTLLILQVMAERLLMELLTGDDDDDENSLQRTIAAAPSDVFGYTTGLLPVVSELGGLGESFFPTGDYGVNYRGPARMALLTDIYSGVGQTMQGGVDDALVKSLVNLSGSAFGLPSAQIGRTYKGTKAVIEGESEGLDIPRALLFGPRD